MSVMVHQNDFSGDEEIRSELSELNEFYYTLLTSTVEKYAPTRQSSSSGPGPAVLGIYQVYVFVSPKVRENAPSTDSLGRDTADWDSSDQNFTDQTGQLRTGSVLLID